MVFSDIVRAFAFVYGEGVVAVAPVPLRRPAAAHEIAPLPHPRDCLPRLRCAGVRLAVKTRESCGDGVATRRRLLYTRGWTLSYVTRRARRFLGRARVAERARRVPDLRV